MPEFALLKVAVNPENPQLVQLYKEHIDKHNAKIKSAVFPDAGFDLFIPSTTYFEHAFETQFINLEIKAEMVYTANTSEKTPTPTGYYVYPRSSISKTPLMLANQTGIIDSGYRGNLITAVRYLATHTEKINTIYELDQHTRLFQICHPALLPILAELVDESELSTTVRGSGGFGSTGAKGTLSR
jgi:dUTP pyrophosphatase